MQYEIYNELCRSMHSLVRIKYESVILDVSTYRHDLTVVRHSHVRDNIHHYQAHHMRIQHGKYYFLSFLWQDYAVWTKRNVFEAMRR